MRINNAHIEEDTGKSLHGDDGRSLVDLNRAGVPLLEIVSEPDMASPDEAHEYCTRLKAMLQYAEVSNCDMEKGQLRVDVNVNMRNTETDERTAISEIKNINSFRYMVQALHYEEKRHIAALESGEKLIRETRLFDSDRGETRPMRSKEGVMDYRYFPEPDLNALTISQDWIDDVRAGMPELPDAKRERYQKDFGLSGYDAGVLVADKDVADFFERCLDAGTDAKQAANWIMGELMREINDSGRALADIPVSPDALAELVALIDKGTISNNIAKKVFAIMTQNGGAPAKIVEREGLTQVSDTGALEAAVVKAIEENPKAVEDFRAGKKSAIGFFMGQVMRLTKGKANPAAVQEILRKHLQ